MATIRELVTVLGFDLKEGPLKRYEASMARAKNAALNLTKAFAAVGAVGGGLFYLTKRVADLGDNLGETAQKIGINAEALQKLQFIGKQSGVEQGQLNSGLRIFSKNLQTALGKGKGAGEAFKKLGISVKDVRGQVKPTEVLFNEVADRFSRMQDGSEKTALAMKLFGRSGADLIPTLNKGGAEIARMGQELKDMGLILTDDTIKASDKFNDSLQLAQGIVGGYVNLLGSEMMPVFQEAITAFIDWAKATAKTGDAQKAVKKIASELSKVIRQILKFVMQLVKELPKLIDALGGAEGIMQKLVIAFAAWVAFNAVSLVGNLAFAFIQLAAAIKLAGFSFAGFSAAFTAFSALGAAAAITGLIFLANEYTKALNRNEQAVKNVMSFETRRREGLNDLGRLFGIDNLGDLRDRLGNTIGDALREAALFGLDVRQGVERMVLQFATAPGRMKIMLVGALNAAWATIKATGTMAIDAILTKIRQIGTAMQTAVSQAITSLKSLAAAFTANTLGFGGFKGFLPSTGGATPGPTSLLKQGPASLSSGGARSTTNNQDVSVASNVTVNVQSQADPNAIAAAANDAVKTAWNSSLRQAQRALQSGEAVG